MDPSYKKLLGFFQSTGMMNEAVAKTVAFQFTKKELKKHEFFLQEGNYSNEYYFLADGVMRSYSLNTEGSEVTTAFFTAPQPVFEVSSFFNRTISKESIQAITDCTGWCINFENLNGLFHEIPQFREFGRSILVKGFASLKERMLSTITETAEERYRKLLLHQPQILQTAQLKHIASYLGVTDSSLSRIRKELVKPS